MCIKAMHIRIKPGHDYMQSLTVFARLAQILMLMHHISCFSKLQEFAEASFSSFCCVYTHSHSSQHNGTAIALLRPAGAQTTRDEVTGV